MGLPTLPDGWTVWNDGSDGRIVLTYRPDVFDSRAFPAACLPTIYVTDGARGGRPAAGRRGDTGWQVALFLEPEVELERRSYDDRPDAVDGAASIAAAFAAGELDYRDAYQVPRESYLDRLDELTERADGSE
ncbi:MAG: DUF5820 family protein [Haloferacaceae archaeon]